MLRDDDNNVWYHLDDQEKAGKLLGKDVLVTGTFDGLTGTIRVQSIVESPPHPKPAANTEEPKQNSEPAKDAAAPPTSADPAAHPLPASSNQLPSRNLLAKCLRRILDPPISAETEVLPEPQGELSGATAREAPPPSSLTLPEEAVSSTSSIAISSSRSVPMPSGVQPGNTICKEFTSRSAAQTRRPLLPPGSHAATD